MPTPGEHGAERRPATASPILAGLPAALDMLPSGRPGVRIGRGALGDLLEAGGPLGTMAAAVLGRGSRPVRAVLFDKTADRNWSLGWHRDRTIGVVRRVDTPGFGPWTIRDGLHHVAPPFALLAGMPTMRIHLDPVDGDNAPLLVAPGSRRLGRICVNEVPGVVSRSGTAVCLADAGDVWLYATPILHASRAAVRGGRRRVLQVDFAACDLPGDLEWLGV